MTDRKIDITEDNDEFGRFIVRGGGERAWTIPELAAKLGVREDQLVFHRNLELAERNRRREAIRRQNTPEAIRARCDFNVFDPYER